MVHDFDAQRIPTIIFDFDGTLALGHGPVRAYADCVAGKLEEADAETATSFLAHVRQELDRYDAGERSYRDGYDIVGSLAKAEGLDGTSLSAAYARSRDILAAPTTGVTTMPGLRDFLMSLRERARLVLATNAPSAGIAGESGLLSIWGVETLFDEVHFEVGKPDGLRRIISGALASGPVLSIGDIHEYDLAPAQALGADTALLGNTASDSPASVTMRAERLAELRGEIETWAATAAHGTPAPHGAPHGIER